MPHIYRQDNKYRPAFNKEQCSASVAQGGRMMGFYQCQRKGKYPDDEGNLWCKQHHPDTVQARIDTEKRKWKEDQEKRERKYARLNAERNFCSGVPTEFLQNNSLQQILKETEDATR